jgi:molybdopterin-containing oxidoreductase family membrane subunit
MKPVRKRPARLALALLCLLVLGCGLIEGYRLLAEGLRSTGLSRPAFWGLLEASFLFLAGAGTSAAFLGALMSLSGREALRAPAWRAHATAVAVLGASSAGLMLHLGRPWLFYRVILDATPSSPLFWDMCFVTGALLLSAAALPGGPWTPLGRAAAGVRRGLALATVALFVAAHTVVWLRLGSVASLPGASTLFGPRILPGALLAGACAVALACLDLARSRRPTAARILGAGSLALLLILWVERWQALVARVTHPPMAYNAGSYTPALVEWTLAAAEAAGAVLVLQALIWWGGGDRGSGADAGRGHQETMHALIR